jgi:hypothetical protein
VRGSRQRLPGGDRAATIARANIRDSKIKSEMFGKEGSKKYNDAVGKDGTSRTFDKPSREDNYSSRTVNKNIRQNIRNVKNAEKFVNKERRKDRDKGK